MEQIEKIRRELEYVRAESDYALSEGDIRGATRAFWWSYGLERALAMLDGDEPLVDDEILEIWRAKRRDAAGEAPDSDGPGR